MAVAADQRRPTAVDLEQLSDLVLELAVVLVARIVAEASQRRPDLVRQVVVLLAVAM